MSRACSTNGSDERSNMQSKFMYRRDHAGDLSVDGRIILEQIIKNGVLRYELDPSGSV